MHAKYFYDVMYFNMCICSLNFNVHIMSALDVNVYFREISEKIISRNQWP